MRRKKKRSSSGSGEELVLPSDAREVRYVERKGIPGMCYQDA